MAIHIQLPTEIELRLKAKAAQRMQTLEEYLQEITCREAQTGNGSSGLTQAELTPEDRATPMARMGQEPPLSSHRCRR